MRADQLRPTAAAGAPISGEVTVVERLGDAEFVYIQAASDREIVVRFEGGSDITVGTTVGLEMPGRFHLFGALGRAIPGVTVA